MMLKRVTQLFVFIFAYAAMQAEGVANNQSFDEWLVGVMREARHAGISGATIRRAFNDISFNEQVIALDRKQPESTKSFEEYIETAVSPNRIQKGISKYRQYRTELEKVGRRYGVQPEYIVALWGIESNFGDQMGSLRIVESLATLAYDGRRSEYFRGELIQALRILDEGHIAPEDMVGSWAGAMGMCQFMPTSFYKYAVDADHDGKIDIWNDTDDVFASIANYLATTGWDSTIGWGEPVYQAHQQTNIISGNSDGSGPFFRVTQNYHNILKWNRSRYFALAVGMLADEIRAGVL